MEQAFQRYTRAHHPSVLPRQKRLGVAVKNGTANNLDAMNNRSSIESARAGAAGLSSQVAAALERLHPVGKPILNMTSPH